MNGSKRIYTEHNYARIRGRPRIINIERLKVPINISSINIVSTIPNSSDIFEVEPDLHYSVENFPEENNVDSITVNDILSESPVSDLHSTSVVNDFFQHNSVPQKRKRNSGDESKIIQFNDSNIEDIELDLAIPSTSSGVRHIRQFENSLKTAEHCYAKSMNILEKESASRKKNSRLKPKIVHVLDSPLFLDAEEIMPMQTFEKSYENEDSDNVNVSHVGNISKKNIPNKSNCKNNESIHRIRINDNSNQLLRTRIGNTIYDLDNPMSLSMRYVLPEQQDNSNNIWSQYDDVQSELQYNNIDAENTTSAFNGLNNHDSSNFNENDYPQHYAGPMNVICHACNAKHFAGERSGNKITFDSCCNHGQVELNLFENFPLELKNLFNGNHEKSKHFFDNIRRINTSFSFASFNAKTIDFSNRRPGPYCFKIQGNIHYQINTALKPQQNEDPSFGQLFIYDSEESIHYRKKRIPQLDRTLLSEIENVMRQNNPFAQSYMMMYEQMELETQIAESTNQPIPVLNLAFTERKEFDRHRYNVQRSNEVAVIFKTTADGNIPHNFIVVRDRHTRKLLEINSLNPQSAPMTYPLFFPNGQFGWKIGMKKKNGKTLTRLQFFKYITSVRDGFNPILKGGRLFQQYLVGEGVNIEKDRLDWCNRNQKKIHVENYHELYKLKELLDRTNATKRIGKIIILPSTFIGSPRYMVQIFQDAMTLAGLEGLPDIFATITCNPNWPEIQENLYPGQRPNDRPDLICRVFHLKLQRFQDEIVKNRFFGRVTNFIYSIEFQKRGLPHAHFLISLLEKLRDKSIIDKFISAEIPDPDKNPILFNSIMTNNIHGPCGEWCEKDGKCSKKFPHDFQNETTIDEHDYPTYRRRDTGKTYTRQDGFEVDNRHVVPYNAALTLMFNCHINVEIVACLKVVKYIFKYVLKGHDAAAISITRSVNVHDDGNDIIEEDHNEILWYSESRYMSPCEAFWRANFRLHVLSHTVVRLPVHLENEHSIVLENELNEMNLEQLQNKATMLSDFFELNKRDAKARNYTYNQIPRHYRFDKVDVNGESKMMWVRRKQFQRFGAIGRIYAISPSNVELFHLRILLLYRKGVTSFQDMKLVNNIQCATYVEACLRLGLIEDDSEWIKSMEDGSFWMMPKQLRRLFARILIHCNPSNSEDLWEKFKEKMSEDMKKKFGKQQAILKSFNVVCRMLQFENKNPKDYFPNIYDTHVLPDEQFNEEIQDIVMNNDVTNLRQSYDSLNREQKSITDKIIQTVMSRNDADPVTNNKCFFIHGPGGSGKTFIYKVLYGLLQSMGKIVCTTAFTGIAATLLPNGRTLHKVVGLPVPMYSDSSSNIKLQSKDAEFLRKVDLIIVDEAPMAPRYAFEILDRLLRELMENDVFFGGKTIILGGDFKQILPVLKRSSRSELIDLSIKNSKLWEHFDVQRLTQNMRTLPSEKDFSQFLIKLGNGELNDNDNNVDLSVFPESCIIKGGNIIMDTYYNIIMNRKFHQLSEIAILAPRNKDVDEINNNIVDLFEESTENVYDAINTIEYGENGNVNENLTPEYLSSLDPPSLPPSKLRIRKNCVVMLIRNLSVNEGLCNGTRLRVLQMRENAILCEILTGDKRGETVFLCRISIRSENDYPFVFKRLQFPIKLAFAMTINKSQGQTFKKVSIDLSKSVFTHGQLYVASSRVKSWSSLRFYVPHDCDKLKNYVFREILI